MHTTFCLPCQYCQCVTVFWMYKEDVSCLKAVYASACFVSVLGVYTMTRVCGVKSLLKFSHLTSELKEVKGSDICDDITLDLLVPAAVKNGVMKLFRIVLVDRMPSPCLVHCCWWLCLTFIPYIHRHVYCGQLECDCITVWLSTEIWLYLLILHYQISLAWSESVCFVSDPFHVGIIYLVSGVIVRLGVLPDFPSVFTWMLQSCIWVNQQVAPAFESYCITGTTCASSLAQWLV